MIEGNRCSYLAMYTSVINPRRRHQKSNFLLNVSSDILHLVPAKLKYMLDILSALIICNRDAGEGIE